MKKFEKIRQEIKKLSDEQKIYKPQRKQSFQGVRTTDSAQAFILDNKFELRHLFQVYALLKGVERQPVTKKYMSESKIQKLVELYKEVE